MPSDNGICSSGQALLAVQLQMLQLGTVLSTDTCFAYRCIAACPCCLPSLHEADQRLLSTMSSRRGLEYAALIIPQLCQTGFDVCHGCMLLCCPRAWRVPAHQGAWTGQRYSYISVHSQGTAGPSSVVIIIAHNHHCIQQLHREACCGRQRWRHRDLEQKVQYLCSFGLHLRASSATDETSMTR